MSTWNKNNGAWKSHTNDTFWADFVLFDWLGFFRSGLFDSLTWFSSVIYHCNLWGPSHICNSLFLDTVEVSPSCPTSQSHIFIWNVKNFSCIPRENQRSDLTHSPIKFCIHSIYWSFKCKQSFVPVDILVQDNRIGCQTTGRPGSWFDQ